MSWMSSERRSQPPVPGFDFGRMPELSSTPQRPGSLALRLSELLRSPAPATVSGDEPGSPASEGLAEDDRVAGIPPVQRQAEGRLLEELATIDREEDGVLSRIFEYYCAFASPLNVTTLTRPGWKRLWRDCGVARSSAEVAHLDLVFARVVRAYSTDVVDDRMTFGSFLLGVSAVAVEHLTAEHRDRLALGEDDALRRGRGTVMDLLRNAQRLLPVPDASVLLESGAVAVLRKHEGILIRLFYHHSEPLGPSGTRVMDFAGLARCARRFYLFPTLVSKPQLFRIFRAVSPQQDPLLYPGFVEIIGRIALEGFAQPGLAELHPRPAQRLRATFDRIIAGEGLIELEADEHARGVNLQELMDPDELKGLPPTTAAAVEEEMDETTEAHLADIARRRVSVAAAALDPRSADTARLGSSGEHKFSDMLSHASPEHSSAATSKASDAGPVARRRASAVLVGGTRPHLHAGPGAHPRRRSHMSPGAAPPAASPAPPSSAPVTPRQPLATPDGRRLAATPRTAGLPRGLSSSTFGAGPARPPRPRTGSAGAPSTVLSEDDTVTDSRVFRYQVNPDIVDACVQRLAPYLPKVRPVFDVYCRVDDPANRGTMSFRNFFRLLKDIHVVGGSAGIPTGDVYLQLLLINRNTARAEHDARRNSLGGTGDRGSVRGGGDTASVADSVATGAVGPGGRKRRRRRSVVMGGGAGATVEGGTLRIEEFLEALVRVSELRREWSQQDTAKDHVTTATGLGGSALVARRGSVSHHPQRVEQTLRTLAASGGASGGEGSFNPLHARTTRGRADHAATATEIQEAQDAVDALIRRRVLPLGRLAEAEKETLALMETEDVMATMRSNRPFLERVFAYFADVDTYRADEASATLRLQDLLRLARAFEVVPKLLGHKDVERVFFGAARRDGTEMDPKSWAAWEAGEEADLPSPEDVAFITFPRFLECVGYFALEGLSRPFVGRMYPTPSAKIEGIILWMRASPVWDQIRAEEHARGFGQRGRRLNRAMLEGSRAKFLRWHGRNVEAAERAEQAEREKEEALASLARLHGEEGGDVGEDTDGANRHGRRRRSFFASIAGGGGGGGGGGDMHHDESKEHEEGGEEGGEDEAPAAPPASVRSRIAEWERRGGKEGEEAMAGPAEPHEEEEREEGEEGEEGEDKRRFGASAGSSLFDLAQTPLTTSPHEDEQEEGEEGGGRSRHARREEARTSDEEEEGEEEEESEVISRVPFSDSGAFGTAVTSPHRGLAPATQHVSPSTTARRRRDMASYAARHSPDKQAHRAPSPRTWEERKSPSPPPLAPAHRAPARAHSPEVLSASDQRRRQLHAVVEESEMLRDALRMQSNRFSQEGVWRSGLRPSVPEPPPAPTAAAGPEQQRPSPLRPHGLHEEVRPTNFPTALSINNEEAEAVWSGTAGWVSPSRRGEAGPVVTTLQLAQARSIYVPGELEHLQRQAVGRELRKARDWAATHRPNLQHSRGFTGQLTRPRAPKFTPRRERGRHRDRWAADQARTELQALIDSDAMFAEASRLWPHGLRSPGSVRGVAQRPPSSASRGRRTRSVSPGTRGRETVRYTAPPGGRSRSVPRLPLTLGMDFPQPAAASPPHPRRAQPPAAASSASRVRFADAVSNFAAGSSPSPQSGVLSRSALGGGEQEGSPAALQAAVSEALSRAAALDRVAESAGWLAGALRSSPQRRRGGGDDGLMEPEDDRENMMGAVEMP